MVQALVLKRIISRAECDGQPGVGWPSFFTSINSESGNYIRENSRSTGFGVAHCKQWPYQKSFADDE